MKKLLFILTAGCTMALVSCEEWLDKYPLAQMSPETFFSNENELQAFSNKFYTAFPSDGLYNEYWDNIIHNDLPQEMRGGRTIPASGGGWTWTNLRDINTLLEYSGNCKDTDVRNRYDALARFFRISLSKGKSIIPVKDELEHVRNYLMIQHMRYKNKFTYDIEADEDVLELASLKLMLQPLVENAIYHGMEFMDGDGEILVRAWRREDDLYMSVSDNGLGMTQEQVERLFRAADHTSSGRGSGIGVKNVNERIKLYFGTGYGLEILSEPDEGTTVTAHLPAIPYQEVKKEEAYVK